MEKHANEPHMASRPHDDPGLQPERTTLAWTRTTAAFLVTAGILLKWTYDFGPPVLILVAVLAVAALAILSRQRARYGRQARAIRRGATPPNLGSVVAITCCLFAAGVAELVFVALRSR